MAFALVHLTALLCQPTHSKLACLVSPSLPFSLCLLSACSKDVFDLSSQQETSRHVSVAAQCMLAHEFARVPNISTCTTLHGIDLWTIHDSMLYTLFAYA